VARKETFSLETLLDTAFEMTREEGFESVTARKVATKVGCSTQPIFRLYNNMDELCQDVYEKAVTFFHDFYSLYPKNGETPFANLGMAYISFAREEKHLFELLFLKELKKKKTLYEVLNGPEGNVMKEMRLAADTGCADPEGLFMKMWIFIHGAACMSMTGDYDLTDAQTVEMLQSVCNSFLKAE